MATRELVTTTDDVDGTPAQETVAFALDGVTYEIDLSADNAARLRDSIAPWVAAGRRLARNGRPYRRINLDEQRRPRRRRP